ncbi:Evolved beta-galactosidase subunit alpha [Caulifigura coniformis]|uniref:Evolved beta-galactosidase subunit alpha n=1 Tax=Caulifigura coniformis TaxID=2527983 RepID=A0A517S7Y0_9PLAN|nr:sugar-binding domain-containing protein [Caulifigura coniformis]QDT52193.1 Evolved beta-galactosidase subunit alpha [Caulifigura coniformis]
MNLLRPLTWMLLLLPSAAFGEWTPVPGKPMTRWAKDVKPETPLPEYPRPQLVREKWQNLNGLWSYAITPLARPVIADEKQDRRGQIAPDAAGEPGEAPTKWDGEILVPFCPESALSGVGKTVGPNSRLWYRRTFNVPADWKGQRIMLNFGAVDWDCTVWLNGRKIGDHQGGYDPFSFDMTEAIRPDGDQELTVAVWDPSHLGVQPVGKQHTNPHGIWYTPVTGIWQTVWMEPVSKGAIDSVVTYTNFHKRMLNVRIKWSGSQQGDICKLTILDGDRIVAENGGTATASSGDLTIGVPADDLKPWTPESPFLYRVYATVERNGKQIDEVYSYAAFREIELKKDSAGVNRLFLNNKPVFQYGPLDQGWWPDGLYTAPTDAALKYDIEITKDLGFNMCRKHVKVEPARWYHWCDKLGLLVWQDMPNGDKNIGRDKPDIERTPASEAVYRKEWTAIVNATKHFPCIVAWVPFNEGWGQFKTNEILDWTRTLDSTRLIDGPSGWVDRKGGDMIDAHIYPGPGMLPIEDKRASVLGEFGGLGLPVDGHTWLDKNNWGYRSYETKQALNDAYSDLLTQIPVLIGQGLSAAVYTQTTDVEIEVNGFLTYDREVLKFDKDRVQKLHARLHEPPPSLKVLVPTSEQEPQAWRYTTDKPADDWMQPTFNDGAWKQGPGGFGTKGTPAAVIGTEWNTKDIWLRRTFELKSTDVDELSLRVHHDEDAEISINGRLVNSLKRFSTEYGPAAIASEIKSALKVGTNVMAVHCRQTGGGQYIDVGLNELRWKR